MKNPSPNKHVMQGVPLTTCFVLLVLACLQLPVSERRGVPHHLIDVLDVHEDYSAGRFHDEAWAVIRDVVAVRPAGLQKRDTGNRTIVSCLVGTAASPEHMDSLLRHTTMLCILAQGKCLLVVHLCDGTYYRERVAFQLRKRQATPNWGTRVSDFARGMSLPETDWARTLNKAIITPEPFPNRV
eukprot:scaffold20345_cov21-Tisochrysis_lutea.AAC.2